MVLYFTATGNCLYVAKELDSSQTSIPKVKQGSVFTDDTIGIVTPVYGGELPNIVLNFIKASTFQTPYLYLILTYGHDATDSAEFTYNQCKALGKKFNYVNNLLMIDNYLPNFDIEKEKAIDKKIPEQLAQIKADIESRKEYIPIASKQAKTANKSFSISIPIPKRSLTARRKIRVCFSSGETRTQRRLSATRAAASPMSAPCTTAFPTRLNSAKRVTMPLP